MSFRTYLIVAFTFAIAVSAMSGYQTYKMRHDAAAFDGVVHCDPAPVCTVIYDGGKAVYHHYTTLNREEIVIAGGVEQVVYETRLNGIYKAGIKIPELPPYVGSIRDRGAAAVRMHFSKSVTAKKSTIVN